MKHAITRLMAVRMVALGVSLVLVLMSGSAVLAQEDDGETYTDPEGLYTFPIPTNWTVTENDGYVTAASPEGGITTNILAVDTADLEQAINEGWDAVDPDFDMESMQTQQIPEAQLGDYDDAIVITYQAGAEGVIQAVAQRFQDKTYVLLVKAELAALQQRQAQFNTLATGFQVTAMEQDDLSGQEAGPVNRAVIAELEGFIQEMMELGEVPGLSIAVVQDDEIVYQNGFGVREMNGDAQVTPETTMAIGSITKTFTTMMMASLVDEGVLSWDTRVQDILPSFSVADPEVSETITVENLVCACSGVPRRDFELLLEYDSLTAEDIIEQLETFEFFTDFGEAFQYSNQMVATGGYVAALATGAELKDVRPAYESLVNARILAPLGMDDTTFDLEAVRSSENLAMPHGRNLRTGYTPIPLDYERFLLPISPSGGLWSNATDMAQYAITALNTGVTPDGTRIVSEENLQATWEPQVDISAQSQYGLGWIIGEYKGVQTIGHDGNTLGYTASMQLVPSSDLGVVVLSNARLANVVHSAISTRLLELVYDVEPEVGDAVRSALSDEEVAAAASEAPVAPAADEPQPETTPEATPQAAPEMTPEASAEAEAEDADFADSVEMDVVEPYLGTWTNDALGEITLSVEDGVLLMDVGEFTLEILPALDDDGEIAGYVSYTPPVASIEVFFDETDDGARQFRIGQGAVAYTFDRVEDE